MSHDIITIEECLSGPSRSKRINYLEKLLTDESVNTQFVETLLLIENVPSTITDYRDRERHLETLLKYLRTEDGANSEKAHYIAFRYLLGSLYVNFEKFWGPTIRVIVDILNQTKFRNPLLQILIQHLRETNDFIYNDDQDKDSKLADDRPDHILHRNFVFQILARFAYYVESNSIIFMDELFRFIQRELLVSPFVERYTRCDLTATKTSPEEAAMQLEDESSLSKPIAMRKGPQKRDKKKKRLPDSLLEKRKSRETFITVAKIIQSFNNMSIVHRQTEFKDLVFNLLSCRDSSVQKAAFNCLLAYNPQHVKPYTDKILKILHDKKVRTELTVFSINADESDQVQAQHRAELIPVLLRILFGRMIGQVGKKSSGRDKADLRKTLVMRFIAGCTVDEIFQFFDLLFEPLSDFASTPYDRLEMALGENLNIKNYIPPNKLQAMISSLAAYIHSITHFQEDSLPYILKMINVITYYVVVPLEDQNLLDQLNFKSVDSFKALRRECLSIMAQFLDIFQYYRYSQGEINFIFKYLVWPSCRGFVDRNHASITPFLKLIESLASHVVYHRLLVKRNNLNRDEYLLSHLMQLYEDKKTKRDVLKFISSVVAKLVRGDDDLSEDSDPAQMDQPEPIIMLEDEDSVAPQYDKQLYKTTDQPMTFGMEIVLAFTPCIFERLRRNCERVTDKEDSSHRIENHELTILSAISNHLRDSDQSLLGARLILTTLSSHKNNALILNTLKTAQALLRQVTRNSDPMIVAYTSNTLGFQRNIEQRHELCNLIDVLAKIDNNLTIVSQIIRLMNSTCEDLVEQPDLAKWSEGFNLAFRYLEELDEAFMNQPNDIKDSLVLLLHQVGFIINSVDRYEFSVRENCTIFYEIFSKKLSLVGDQHKAFLDEILNDIVLEKFLKKGLRETNESIRHTYIVILRSLAVHCHKTNKTLNEFYIFCDQNQDLDFWDGIKHIQLHNRSKALARLIANEKIYQVSPTTLSSYFMPIAAGFLFSKNFKSVSSLSENSIKLIGIVCKQLNWVTYESVLSYYLGLLTKANSMYQKTNIKLITEIIKNFNFDISSCEEANQFQEENKKLEERMRKRRGKRVTEASVAATDTPNGKKLNPSTARMVYIAVTKKLIPRLNSCLHEMTRVELEHDKNMSNYLPEKDEIKRIPIAFAIVQLLNLLPCKYVLFRDHLPALFLKLTSFLKSKNEDTRKAARMTLIRIMNFTGPAYLPDLLRVLKQNLDKGFHVHVLNFTIHSVLEKSPLNYGDLDGCVHELIDSCLKEIFGKVAEDKEIAQVIAKTPEAKKTKSYDTLLILSSYISSDKLDELFSSIKNLLSNSSDSKKVNKLSVCLQRVFTGLSQNQDFPLDNLLSFIEATIEESIPCLKIRQKVDQAENAIMHDSKTPLREDRYLITKDPTKDRIKSKINEKGNLHMVIENCLRLLLLCFEKNKITIKKNKSVQKRLDGFIGILTTCLKSSSPRCVMRALKCIYFIARTNPDLPSFKTKCRSIVKKVFILLNLYNGVGMVHGDNYEMIGMCFKTLTLLLLRCEHVELNEAQVRALMSYIEQDLCDVSRQATAFGTLQSLLQKKIDTPELGDIMSKVADLLVTSGDDSVRSLSIKAWQIYLLEYNHEGTRLQLHLSRFLRQLDYEFIDGRRSILKMLHVIIEKFPERILRDYLDLFFNLLAQRIVNDDSKEVRHTVGRLIALLVQRLPDNRAYLLNKFVFHWAVDPNTGLKLLGIKLISIFLEASRDMFEKKKDRLTKVLSIVSDALEHCKSSSKADDENIEPSEDAMETDTDMDPQEKSVLKIISAFDKLNYHSLRLFKRILDKNLISCVEGRFINHLKKIWQNVADKLSYWHEPVVLTSCQLYLIFIKSNDIASALSVENPNSDAYLEWNAKRIVRLLCDKYFDLMDRVDESSPVLNYIIESLVLLGLSVTQCTATLEFERSYCESFDNGDVINHLLNLKDLPNDGFVKDNLPYKLTEARKKVDLAWLSVKVVMQARKEAALYRLSKGHRRDFVLKWSAAISQELGPKRIAPYVFLLTMTPVRELTDKLKTKTDDSSLRHNFTAMSEDLLKFIKSLVGVELFNKVYSKVQLHYTRKRIDRKKNEAVARVKDLARGVKRKMKERKAKDLKRRKNKVKARHGINGRNFGNKRSRP